MRNSDFYFKIYTVGRLEVEAILCRLYPRVIVYSWGRKLSGPYSLWDTL